MHTSTDWKINRDHQIIIQDSNDDWRVFCEKMCVVAVRQDILGESRELSVSIYKGQRWVRPPRPFSRAELLKEPVRELAPYGLSLANTLSNNRILAEILLDLEDMAPTEYHYRELGFAEIDGNRVFLADSPIGFSANHPYAKARYCEGFRTTPIGSYETWLRMVQVEIKRWPTLALALCMAAAAPLAHLLQGMSVVDLIPLFALIGTSSTGKTTALRLIASVYGCPNERDGLLDDLNTTENAFFTQLNQKRGVPILIDETSMQPSWDFTRTLYSLPKGRSKRRCDNAGDLRETKSFSGAIIFTGESSIFEQTGGNLGLYARLAEITQQWTMDGEQADYITRTVRQNYGWAVYPLISWIMEHEAELANAFEAENQGLQQWMLRQGHQLDGVGKRILKNLSLLMLGGRIIGRALDIEMPMEFLLEALTALFESSEAHSFEEEVYYSVLAAIADNIGNFWIGNDPALRGMRSCWGLMESIKNKGQTEQCVWIIKDHFNAILKSLNKGTPRSIIFSLGKDGRLVKFKEDRYVCEHSIGGISFQCYCLICEKGWDEFISDSRRKQ